MMLQAVVDDSGKGQKPVFVLAGLVLRQDQWVAFTNSWKAILDTSPKLEYFKMKEAAHCVGQFKRFSTADRDKRLQELVSLILAYQPLAIRNVIPHQAYEEVFKGKIAKGLDYPYFLSFYGIIGALLKYQFSEQRQMMARSTSYSMNREKRPL
jgi:hypothetical protein